MFCKNYFYRMLYSEKYQVQWWRVMRNASRALEGIPRKLNFVDFEHSHRCLIKNPDWSVVLCCRNPYGRAISFWLLRNKYQDCHQNNLSFEEYLQDNKNEYFRFVLGELYEPITVLEQNPNLKVQLIRYENFYNDLFKIPFVKENYELLSDYLEMLRDPNLYRGEYTIDLSTPYHEFYTQELADIVWNKKQYEFEYWGYERESWKTLIH
jgi:Sulfotransferase domain